MFHNAIEKHFWLLFIAAIAFGLIIPDIFKPLSPYITYILMAMLFFSFLNINTKELTSYIKRPLLITYIVSFSSIIIPIILFYAVKSIMPSLALPTLVLAALPPAIASPVLASIVKGKGPLTLIIVVTSSILYPLTFPLLLYFLAGATTKIAIIPMILLLAQLIFIPLVAAQILKKPLKKLKKYSQSISIILITLLIVTIISQQASYIISNSDKIVISLIYLYAFFTVLHFIGYFLALWLKKEERIGVTVTTAYKNLGLGLVLASKFFGPYTILLVVFSQLVPNTLIILFRYVAKKIS